jgi:glycosyltransferase involved in cell wall biosynthesis
MATEVQLQEQLQQNSPDELRPKTSIVIPAYNEQAGLAVILEKLNGTVDDSFEVLVVDDGSTDNTKKVAEKYRCRMIAHAINRGKGAAVQSGICAARGESVIVIDADDTYPVEAVPQIAESLSTFDMAIASRVRGRDNISLLHRIGNSLFRNLIRHLYGFRPLDPLAGLYGVRRQHLLRMRLESTDFGIESEIAIKGARMA